MNVAVVGVSDCLASDGRPKMLVTYALGSCIGLAIYDPVTKVGGLLHFMLPESSLDPEKARQNPYMFADTGVRAMLAILKKQGLNTRRCLVKLAGGAQILSGAGTFEIGKRNYLAVKKALWKEGLMITAQAVGGEISRTVRLDLASGRCYVREPAGIEVELAGRENGGGAWRSAS